MSVFELVAKAPFKVSEKKKTLLEHDLSHSYLSLV